MMLTKGQWPHRAPRRPGADVVQALESRVLLAATPAGIALDTAFGNGGRVLTDLDLNNSSYDDAYDAAALPGGDFVLVGINGAIARYHADGSLDTGFGAGGVVRGSERADVTWNSVLALPDGDIVVGGRDVVSRDGTLYAEPLLARYNPDGSLDPAFGLDGTGQLWLGAGGDVSALALQPDGRIVAAGDVLPDGSATYETAIWRLGADGSADPSFGDGGRAIVSTSIDYVDSVMALSDGSLLVTNPMGYRLFTPSGAPAAPFVLLEKVVAGTGPDGSVYLAGRQGVVRLHPDGTPDPSFSPGSLGLATGFDPTAVHVQPGGSVVVGMKWVRADNPSEVAHFLVRLNADGSADPHFGPGGLQYLYHGTLRALLPAPGNGLIAAGSSWVYSPASNIVDFHAQRYVLDPPLLVGGHQVGGTVDEGTFTPFTAADSSYANGTIARYEWDDDHWYYPYTYLLPFGYNVTQQGRDVLVPLRDDHSPQRGSFVVVRVTTGDGLQATSQPMEVHVRNVAPTVEAINWDPSQKIGPWAVVGRETSVFVKVHDPGTDGPTATVDFGDGTPPVPVNSGWQAVHAYAARGDYTVTVTATDDDGASSARQAIIHVVQAAGRVVRDLDDDGPDGLHLDAPMEGVTVYADRDNDGVLDDGEARTLTDAGGVYRLDALPAGKYPIHVVAPPGLRANGDEGARRTDVIDDTYGVLASFGLTDRARLSGVVFRDSNADGKLGSSERSSFLTSGNYLDLDNDGEYDLGEPLPVRDPYAFDVYLFRNLAPGTYTVRWSDALAPSGYNDDVQTLPATGGGNAGYTVTLPVAGEAKDLNFGFYRPNSFVLNLTGKVFNDRNGDGSSGAGEESLAGRVLYVDANGSGTLDVNETRVRTATDGTFRLPVLAGTYLLRLKPNGGWAQTKPQDNGGITVTADGVRAPAALSFGARFVGTPAVVGRHVFYNGATLRLGGFLLSPDMLVATDKRALTPGERPSSANVTGYSRGINGVMFDVSGALPAAVLARLSEDATFKTGRGGDASTWVDAPRPTVSVRPGAGVDGSDRVTLTWPDGAVKNTWLQVTVPARPELGLAADDVFLFGNLVGETGDAGSPFRVGALDLGGVKRFLNATELNSPVDINRDGRINSLDLAAIKANLNRSLSTPTAPAPAAGVPPTSEKRDLSTSPVWEEPGVPLL